MMNFKPMFIRAGLLTGSFFALANAPAQAFSFTTNLAPGSAPPTGNITLESITLGDGTTISDFSLINDAVIVSNPPYTGGNSGAASSDRGDTATGVQVEDPTTGDIVASLGNLNLNNIIDTEDVGPSKINLYFASAVDSLFLWERGQNSKLGIQALDSAGNPFGSLLVVDSSTFDSAGYSIDTTEITGSQPVGSLGVSLADLGVSGPISAIQVTSTKSYNGPDYKIVGALSTQSVPEPTALAGLGLAAATLTTSRRRKAVKQA